MPSRAVTDVPVQHIRGKTLETVVTELLAARATPSGLLPARRFSVLDKMLQLRERGVLPLALDRAGNPVPPSGSEVRRWLRGGSVRLNRRRASADDPWPVLVWDLCLHPRGKRRCTLF